MLEHEGTGLCDVIVGFEFVLLYRNEVRQELLGQEPLLERNPSSGVDNDCTYAFWIRFPTLIARV